MPCAAGDRNVLDKVVNKYFQFADWFDDKNIVVRVLLFPIRGIYFLIAMTLFSRGYGWDGPGGV